LRNQGAARGWPIDKGEAEEEFFYGLAKLVIADRDEITFERVHEASSAILVPMAAIRIPMALSLVRSRYGAAGPCAVSACETGENPHEILVILSLSDYPESQEVPIK
jgi:hypothetical protein